MPPLYCVLCLSSAMNDGGSIAESMGETVTVSVNEDDHAAITIANGQAVCANHFMEVVVPDGTTSPVLITKKVDGSEPTTPPLLNRLYRRACEWIG